MRVGSLFSGVGGLDLGLEWAGMEIVWQCEVDEYASAVLRKHWPNVPNVGDIKAIDPANLPPVDLVCGGYPCQPFSVAGKRKGQNDDRHLWPYMRQVVETVRPTWCLCENVAGHVTMGLDSVLSDLEALGYACWPLVIPACAVDAQHIRERVFVVAHADGGRELQSERGQREQRGWAGDGASEIAADVVFQGLQIRQGKNTNRPGPDCRTIFTGIPWRDHQPLLGGRVHGVSSRMDRIERLGNAVVPQVAYQIGRAIMAAHYGYAA